MYAMKEFNSLDSTPTWPNTETAPYVTQLGEANLHYAWSQRTSYTVLCTKFREFKVAANKPEDENSHPTTLAPLFARTRTVTIHDKHISCTYKNGKGVILCAHILCQLQIVC